MTVADFLSKVGRKKFQQVTGFSAQLVSRAKREGVFPAHWIWLVREFCVAGGYELPEELFRGHPDAVQDAAA